MPMQYRFEQGNRLKDDAIKGRSVIESDNLGTAEENI